MVNRGTGRPRWRRRVAAAADPVETGSAHPPPFAPPAGCPGLPLASGRLDEEDGGGCRPGHRRRGRRAGVRSTAVGGGGGRASEYCECEFLFLTVMRHGVRTTRSEVREVISGLSDVGCAWAVGRGPWTALVSATIQKNKLPSNFHF
jgi:hypothetical protein